MSQGDELADGLSRAFAKVSIRDVLFGDSQDVREGEEEDALDDALDAIVMECTKRMPRTDIEALQPVRPIGIGGQGGVWLAQVPDTRMKYAVKQFSKSRLSNLTKKAALRALNERECLMDLGYHPFIVTCYASFQTSSALFLVLELCPGGDMFELVSNYALEEGHARFYISCITLALRHMHVNGWHYRDIKRENVLIDCDGYAKLCDFGFATKVRLCEARGSFHMPEAPFACRERMAATILSQALPLEPPPLVVSSLLIALGHSLFSPSLPHSLLCRLDPRGASQTAEQMSMWLPR